MSAVGCRYPEAKRLSCRAKSRVGVVRTHRALKTTNDDTTRRWNLTFRRLVTLESAAFQDSVDGKLPQVWQS